jgi:hypothetical protein
MDGKRPQWASVAEVSQIIKVKDEQMLSSAISLAAWKGGSWWEGSRSIAYC